MISRTVQLNTSSYTEITSATEFLLQNCSNTTQQIVVANTQPVNDTNGFNLKSQEAMNQTLISGRIWGKGSGIVVVAD